MAMSDFEHILEKVVAERSAGIPSAVSDDYKKGWYDGYHAAQRENPTITHPVIPTIAAPSLSTACGVCGINFGAGPMGFVCNNDKCPSRITAQRGATVSLISEPFYTSPASHTGAMGASGGAGTFYSPMGGAGANGGTEIKS